MEYLQRNSNKERDSWQVICQLLIYERKENRMENIEMVSGYFAKAGYESRLNDEKYLEQVINCMKNAGVLKVDHVSGENNTIKFEIICSKLVIEYYLKIISSLNKIWIVQEVFSISGNKSKLAEWYLRKRNEELNEELKYNMNTYCLEGQVLMRSDWERNLIQKIGSMNRTILKDYDILKMLRDGKIPDEIRTGVVNEYREYEREMNYASHI